MSRGTEITAARQCHARPVLDQVDCYFSSRPEPMTSTSRPRYEAPLQ